MSFYFGKSEDKNGRTLYWKISKEAGKKKRVTKQVFLDSLDTSSESKDGVLALPHSNKSILKPIKNSEEKVAEAIPKKKVIYARFSISFDEHFQQEHGEVRFSDKKEKGNEWLDLSFLFDDQSPEIQKYEGVMRPPHKTPSFYVEDDVDSGTSRYPDLDTIYWSWKALRNLYNGLPSSDSEFSGEEEEPRYYDTIEDPDKEYSGEEDLEEEETKSRKDYRLDNTKYVLVEYYDPGKEEVEVGLIGEKTLTEIEEWLRKRLSRLSEEEIKEMVKELATNDEVSHRGYSFVITQDPPPEIRKEGWTVTVAEATESFTIYPFKYYDQAIDFIINRNKRSSTLFSKLGRSGFPVTIVLDKWKNGIPEEVDYA